MKYLGSLDELKALVDTLPITGTWQWESESRIMFRCSTGANFHFSTTRHSVWFDGDAAAIDDLKALVVEGLQANAMKSRSLDSTPLLADGGATTARAAKPRKVLRVVRKLHQGR